MSFRYGLTLIVSALLLATLCNPVHTIAQTTYLEITDPAHFPLTPALVPAVQTYRWRNVTGGSDPAEVRHILVSTVPFGSYAATLAYIIGNPNAAEWSPWVPYAPPGDGTSWTTPPVEFGGYVFAVQGRDNSGNTEPITVGRNARYVRYAAHVTGPLLTVTGDLIDPIVTSSTSTPITEIGVEGGTPLSFCWVADASAYGASVTGYRYGWDLTDPDDESQWEMAFTPLPTDGACSVPTSFQGGTHRIDIEVIDNTYVKSRVPIVINLSATPASPRTWGAVKALYRSP
jgi:hypothetical protein